MSGRQDRSWVRRTEVALAPDPTRVVARLFLPGQELAMAGESRSTTLLGRVLALTDAEVSAELARLTETYAHRHRDLESTWSEHLALVAHELTDIDVDEDRRRLAGAVFTQEFAIEAAALFNPSVVRHPDQSGLPSGSMRFLMTLRGVGDGHVSSIELRTGVLGPGDSVELDEAPRFATLAHPTSPEWSRDAFAHQLRDTWGDRASADVVLGALPERFGREQLDGALQGLRDQQLTRVAASRTIEQFEWIAACSYDVEFASSSLLQERVLMPRGPAESRGMEDLRLVHLGADGPEPYVGTYTAFDGDRITSQLILTSDFRRFAVRRLSGPGSGDKGMAVFPRRVDGRFVALSRASGQSNGITTSVDLQHWDTPVDIQRPTRPWELVQLGNCGPPLETDAGWLVLTHGVGPMREYSIGAVLLDLDDPTRVIGSLDEPLLRPAHDERSGLVPNVVYSCGALVHGEDLVLPYGCSDMVSRVAFVSLAPLISELTTSVAGPHHHPIEAR
jgi:predicted GH43/DUF377 family glycosyl hydrolase